MSEALHLVEFLGDKVVWAIGVVAIIVAVVAAPWLWRWLKPIVYRHAKGVAAAPEVMIAAKDSIHELAKNHAALVYNHGLLEQRVQALEAVQARQLELIKRLIELQSPEAKQKMERRAIINELGRVTAPGAGLGGARWPLR